MASLLIIINFDNFNITTMTRAESAEYIVLSSDSSNDPPVYESDGCDSVVYLGTSMGRLTVKVGTDPDKCNGHDSSK